MDTPTRLLCPWGVSRQEYWSGLPCTPPGDPPNLGIKPRSPTLQADSLSSEPPGKPNYILSKQASLIGKENSVNREALSFKEEGAVQGWAVPQAAASGK